MEKKFYEREEAIEVAGKVTGNKDFRNMNCPCVRWECTCPVRTYCRWCRDFHLIFKGWPACYDNNPEAYQKWKLFNQKRKEKINNGEY